MRPQHRSPVVTALCVLALAVVVLAVPANAATKRIPNFGGGCNPTATKTGDPVTCYAYVDAQLQDDPAPTGRLTFSVPSFKGTLSRTSCDAADGFCNVSYTPKGAGSATRKDTITISYSGDSFWAADTTSVVVAVPVKLPANFNVYCQEWSTLPGRAVQCTASVYPTSGQPVWPTGIVSFAVPSYKGAVTPTSCEIVDSSCHFSYTPIGSGSATRKDTITATYSGDADWASSLTNVVIAVPVRLPVYLSTYCDQGATAPGVPATCTIDIQPTGSGPVLTGTVSLTVPTYKGTLTPAGCAASTGSCSYTYVPKGSGSAWRKDTITATYPGDSFWAPGKTTVVLEVPAS